MRKIFYFVITLLFIQSCQSFFEKNPVYHYIFIGHSYQWNAPNWGRADYRLEKIQLDTFDQIWLGGDLVENLFHHPDNPVFVDTFFRAGAPTTHWAIGNHDVLDQQGNFSKIEEMTHRKTYNTTHVNGITILVLNTTEFYFPQYNPKPHECKNLDAQWNLIKAVTDTIQASSHLVVLHHHALLTNEMADNKIDLSKIFNYYVPSFQISCAERGSFSSLVYPRLLKVQKRGVQVILVGGDTGQSVKEFEFETKEGIVFLGSGLNNSAGTKGRPAHFIPDPDKVLIFRHEPYLRKLDWEFRLLPPL